VLTNGTNVDSGANLTVTIPAANPPVSSASITGTGFTTINLSAAQITAAAAAGGTTIAVTGLTNGTTYNLTLSATNGVGSPATATASVTPAAVALNNVTGVNVTGVTASAATVNWSIPAANTTVPGTPAPTGYSVTVTSTTTGATGTGTFTPTPNVGTATSLTLSGLSASGNYSVTVTAVYSAAVLAANPLSAAPAGVGFAMQSNAVIYQDIQVNKPNGLLVMTQRCYANPSATSGTAPTWTITTPGTTNVLPVVGNSTANGPLSINGPIAAQSATQAGKGFPTGIPATPATSLVKNGTLDGQTTDLASSAVNGPGNSGVAPIISATPFDGTSTPWSGSPGTAGTDPLFSANASLLSGYPFPTNADGSLPTTNYGTRCSLNLGNAHLVTTGANAGQYFAASGQIDQITVVNTQDTDAGYSVTGQVSSFLNTVQTGGGNRSFSGDYLGWTPQAPAYITPGQNDGLGLKYDTQATAGPDAQQGVPSTVGTLAAPSNVGGLANAKTLVSSPSGHSLGIVQADARLRLIIPTSVVSGVYHGTLTFQAFG
jgi:hypothetical protein